MYKNENRKFNEQINRIINESSEDDEDMELTDEAKAVAKFLGVSESEVKDVEMGPYEMFSNTLYKVESIHDGIKETYLVSSDKANIQIAVEDSLENLFDGLTVDEFCEKVIPYLPRDREEYISAYYEGFDLIEEGDFDGTWGRDFHGFVDFTKMAEDVIDVYGAGHELSVYDNKTNQVDFEGETYYIFKQDEESLNESKKRNFNEMKDYPKMLSTLLRKCWYDGDGKFARNGKWSIGLGGYDHGYEIYYNGETICQIKPDNEVYFGRDEKTIKRICGFDYEQILKAIQEVEPKAFKIDDEQEYALVIYYDENNLRELSDFFNGLDLELSFEGANRVRYYSKDEDYLKELSIEIEKLDSVRKTEIIEVF